MLAVCYGVWSSSRGRRWIEREFGRKFGRIEESMEWIGKTSEFGGKESIYGVRICGRAIREIYLGKKGERKENALSP